MKLPSIALRSRNLNQEMNQEQEAINFPIPQMFGIPKFWMSTPVFIHQDAIQKSNEIKKKNKQKNKKSNILITSLSRNNSSLENEDDDDIGARFKEMVKAELEKAKSENCSRH